MNACPEVWNGERAALAVQALQRSGVLRLRLLGQSMLPSLWPGDEVELVGCSTADLRPGDIVLACRGERFFLHRMIALSDRGEVITRGDAMPSPDPALPAQSVVGRVARVFRGERAFAVSKRCTVLRRSLGLLFCYSGLARNVALRFRGRRTPSTENLQPETQQAASLHLKAR